MPEVVRKRLRANEHSRRTLDTRAALRFPWVAAATARVIANLALSSRLRQAVLRRAVRTRRREARDGRPVVRRLSLLSTPAGRLLVPLGRPGDPTARAGPPAVRSRLVLDRYREALTVYDEEASINSRLRCCTCPARS